MCSCKVIGVCTSSYKIANALNEPLENLQGVNRRQQAGDCCVQGAAAGTGESVPLLQQQQQQQVALQDTYYSSRAEALQNVESTIVELGGIFQQLAHMVGAVTGRRHHQQERWSYLTPSMSQQLGHVHNPVQGCQWLAVAACPIANTCNLQRD